MPIFKFTHMLLSPNIHQPGLTSPIILPLSTSPYRSRSLQLIIVFFSTSVFVTVDFLTHLVVTKWNKAVKIRVKCKFHFDQSPRGQRCTQSSSVCVCVKSYKSLSVDRWNKTKIILINQHRAARMPKRKTSPSSNGINLCGLAQLVGHWCSTEEIKKDWLKDPTRPV